MLLKSLDKTLLLYVFCCLSVGLSAQDEKAAAKRYAEKHQKVSKAELEREQIRLKAEWKAQKETTQDKVYEVDLEPSSSRKEQLKQIHINRQLKEEEERAAALKTYKEEAYKK